MRLEDGLDGGPDPDFLMRIAEEVPEHPDMAGLRQLHQRHDVRGMPLERWMHRMPGPLPAIDETPTLHPLPFEVEGQALVADPLRSPEPGAAIAAALDAQLVLPCALPVRGIEAVGLGDRSGKAGREVVRARRQSVSAPPKMTLDTGVTIGPEMTIDTCAPGTWLVDSPRSWRTASIWSSRPCI